MGGEPDQSQEPQKPQSAEAVSARRAANIAAGTAGVVGGLSAGIARGGIGVGGGILISLRRGFGARSDAVDILPILNFVFGQGEHRVELVRETGQAALVQKEDKGLFLEEIVGNGDLGLAE